MLLSKTAQVKWNGHNMRYYISKGYNYTKVGELFEVKIEDLLENSRVEVEVQCDYCNTKFKQGYDLYIQAIKSYIPKNACDNCKSIKLKEVRKIQKELPKPNRKERKNKNIVITEEQLVKDISYLVKKYGRFPNQTEIKNELNITQKVIKSFGGLQHFRNLLNYKDAKELIDDRGYLNSSTYEYITAQFLIRYNIPYKREEHPFPQKEGNYRSDFTFYTTNGEEIHCEVWGYDSQRTNSKINNRYREHRNEKEKLYNKYSIILISIECEIFNNTYDNIQKEMYNIFKPYLNLNFKNVSSDYLIPPTKVSDEELFKRTMELSKDGVTMPSPKDLRVNHSGLYRQIWLRFGAWINFAERFGMGKDIKGHGYWTENRLYDTFVYALNKYNKVLSGDEFQFYSKNDVRLKGYYSAIKRKGKYIDYMLKFAEKYIKDNMHFNNSLNMYLIKVINKINRNTSIDQQEYANKILKDMNKLIINNS